MGTCVDGLTGFFFCVSILLQWTLEWLLGWERGRLGGTSVPEKTLDFEMVESSYRGAGEGRQVDLALEMRAENEAGLHCHRGVP